MTGLPATGIQGEPEIWVLLPTSEPAVFEHNAPLQQLTRIARRAEDLGFDSLWAGESLQSPRFEPLAALAVAAAATGRVRLGTASMIPAYRQPVATAQQIATIDRLTEGRLVLGVGAGYPMPRTQAALELASVDYRRRVTLLDDIAALWRAMWGTGATDFDGKLLHLRDLPPRQSPHQRGAGPLVGQRHRRSPRSGRCRLRRLAPVSHRPRGIRRGLGAGAGRVDVGPAISRRGDPRAVRDGARDRRRRAGAPGARRVLPGDLRAPGRGRGLDPGADRR